MLNENGFDLWADGYDKTVGLSDEDGSYPFAGYRSILNAIYNEILAKPRCTVLDIGFGTGTLTSRLYESGCTIYGQDFSQRMIQLAQEKMPEAKLYQGDFSRGLVPELEAQQYDFITATYSLHHLTDSQKAEFLPHLKSLLRPGGKLLIGDVAFSSREQLEACAASAGDEWDDEEIYFVHDELLPAIPGLTFRQLSDCAGILTLQAD